MAVLTRLVLVAVLVTSGSVEGIWVSMNPSIITEGKTSTLTIRCQTDAASTDNVYAIKITKPPSATNLAIVDSRGPRVDASIQQRATATGTVSPPEGSYLVLNFTDGVSCSDAGEYSCQYNSENTYGQMANKTLQGSSDPRDIEIVATPTLDFYRENVTVELVCSGFIGKPATGSWVWEARDGPFNSTWTPLRPGLTPVDGIPAVSGQCQMTGRSTLRIQLQMEDDNRMYRCYYRDPVYSANFTFQVTHGTVTTFSPPSKPSRGSALSEVRGQAVGAGLAVWALLTFLLTLGGQGHIQPSSTSQAPPRL